jgi:2-polyprenyl-3-methyl-5-hydroxy-6-metoxy-1,4-benzoquinol methylase
MAADLAHRKLEPEILDGLSRDDPRAVASRRDLRCINTLMFQSGIMVRLLSRHVKKAPDRILEIGAGDGAFMLSVARRLAKTWPGVELTLLDRADLITAERAADFARLGWRAEAVTADVFDWLEEAPGERFDVVVANLFLHHFSDAGLARLFSSVQPLTGAFLATEPRRGAAALAASRLLLAIGANEVTLRDAPASVRAGFGGAELSALWPDGIMKPVEERRIGPFTHIFAATRKSS